LGLDSFIFIDDNKHERNLIKNSLPQLEVFNFPTELTLLPRAIKQTESLKTFKVTDEDLLKTKQYAVELNRNELKIKMKYSDFLKSLNLKCEIEKLNKKNFTRFCQLILKVNQFNLTNIRYSDSQIKQMSLQKDIKMFTVKAEDKFGKLGIISVIILKILKGEVFIDTFLMSCRAIGKELEIFIINFIKQYVKIYFPKHILIGIFSKSKKNKYLVSKFYEQNEFSILKNKNNVKYFKCYDFKIKYPKHIKFLNLKKY
jgi:FkbH-like protein